MPQSSVAWCHKPLSPDATIQCVYRNAVRMSLGVQFDSITKTAQLMMCDDVMAVRFVSQRKTGKCILKIQRFHRQPWRYRNLQLAFKTVQLLSAFRDVSPLKKSRPSVVPAQPSINLLEPEFYI